MRQVGVDGLGARLVQVDRALLAALAADGQNPLIKIQLIQG